MNKRFVLPVLIFAGLHLGSMPSVAQDMRPGIWEVTTQLKGGPRSHDAMVRSACLSQESLTAGPEQALLDVSASSKDGRETAPKCLVSELKKSPKGSEWTANCEGPRGSMQGTGTGTTGADAATLMQIFKVKLPFGSVTLEQSVAARRTGDC